MQVRMNENKNVLESLRDADVQLRKQNYSLFATPAEGLSGRFTRMDREKYGVVKDVTDKDYYTNSAHVDVRDQVSMEKKMQVEGPFHTLCTAGAIAYIETDGLINGNPQAFEEILRMMHDQEIGYGSISHPIDECNVCHYTGVIEDGEPCPKCGCDDEDQIIRYRRVTGYLSAGGAKRWNGGKRSELKDRVKHH